MYLSIQHIWLWPLVSVKLWPLVSVKLLCIGFAHFWSRKLTAELIYKKQKLIKKLETFGLVIKLGLLIVKLFETEFSLREQHKTCSTGYISFLSNGINILTYIPQSFFRWVLPYIDPTIQHWIILSPLYWKRSRLEESLAAVAGGSISTSGVYGNREKER